MHKREYADVFYGNGATHLPEPEGIAKTWFFIKAQCGNTHPHASLPFGKMSCGLYTGGYPTGRGNHNPNSCGPVTTFAASVLGFSHMHQSGTGGTGTYYNYAVVSPMYGDLRELSESVESETGEPGYYAATLRESGITGEFTVDGATAIHRYTLSDKAILSIDFSNDGLSRAFSEKFYRKALNGEVRIEGKNCLSAAVILHGIRTFFYVICEGETDSVFLWEDFEKKKGNLLQKSDTLLRWGGAFSVSGSCVLKVAVSHKSIEEAKKSATSASDFDGARKKAAKQWEDCLGRIEIDADEKTKRMFYSNLYHSIVKPSAFEDGKYTDFSTLWDMYKTQLPLIYTLFSDVSKGVIKTILDTGKVHGRVPIALMLTDEIHRFDGQARMLSVYTLADAFYRGHATARNVVKTALGETLPDMEKTLDALREEERYTHILDVTEACAAAARIADEAGDKERKAYFSRFAARWTEAFDKKTGLLQDGSAYYEGDRWNYSFRILSDMEERMALCGSKEAFVKLADSFFGYGKAPVFQSPHPDDEAYISGLALHRFDGTNNEHDMESPYVYIFAGRHDKTCEVLNGIRQFMYTEGEGGLPGNNDTGALSSLYVWNTLGIFPVSGQDKMLVGLPGIRTAKLHLTNGKTFEIRVHGTGAMVDKAELNGRVLSDMQFTVREMMQGGILSVLLK